MRSATRAWLAALLSLGLWTGTANADTTVRVLTLEPDGGPPQRAVDAQAAKEFEAAHPGVHVEIVYLENEAYKAKLPTALQSSGRPHIFYSWGGGVFDEQVKNGLCQDLTPWLKDELTRVQPQAALAAFTRDGKIYGAPAYTTLVVLWYNKALAAKAGIDVPAIKTWDDFLAAVKKARAAGVTPIVLGAKDKWPVHFYYAYLALRIAGKDGLARAERGEAGGFAGADLLRATKELQRLVDLKPFQEGFADATYDKASGMFGDGKALFHLMGSWDHQNSRKRSQDGKGLSDEQLGFIAFPMVGGGKGNANDTLGGINGWVAAKGAPKEAAEFLAYFTGKANSERLAKGGFVLPTALGANQALANPVERRLLELVAKSTYHQLYLDQAFGPALGGAVNDASTDVALGTATPEVAAKSIEDARKQR